MRLEVINEFRKVTGWDEDKVLAEVPAIQCRYDDSLSFYASYGRLPNPEEAQLLRIYGYQICKDIFPILLK
jgi:hypothetical protein